MGVRTLGFVFVKAREENFHTYQVSHRVVLGQTFAGAFGVLKTTRVGVGPTQEIV